MGVGKLRHREASCFEVWEHGGWGLGKSGVLGQAGLNPGADLEVFTAQNDLGGGAHVVQTLPELE